MKNIDRVLFVSMFLLCVLMLFINIDSNNKRNSLKDQKIAELQAQNLKADSLYRIKEELFRSSVNAKIDRLNSEIQVLQVQNEILTSKFKSKTETYQKQRYKPIKYW